MNKSVKFYFDFISPYSYLAWSQLRDVTQPTNVLFEPIPISVGALMREVGNRPTSIECAAKAAYSMQDLTRWAKRLRVPIAPNPHMMTMDTRPMLMGAISAQNLGVMSEYIAVVFEGMWRNASPFDKPEVLLKAIENVPQAQKLVVAAYDGSLREALKANTAQAVADGAFGVPSFVYKGKLFFGNDRMMFLEEALAV